MIGVARCDSTTFPRSCGSSRPRRSTQLGRSQLYEQTKRWRATGGKEDIPVVRFGRCLRIPKAALLRLAEVEPEHDDAA